MPTVSSIVTTFAVVLLLGLNSAQGQEVTKADKVKAAIVFKLTKFISWPEKKQTLALCIIGQGAINSEIHKSNHKFSLGRRISVTHKKPSASLSKLCDLIYIHNTKSAAILEVINKLQDKPVLTISDSQNFANQGGVIELFRAGSRIRFAINQKVVQNIGLTINPQLMGLAKVVK